MKCQGLGAFRDEKGYCLCEPRETDWGLRYSVSMQYSSMVGTKEFATLAVPAVKGGDCADLQ